MRKQIMQAMVAGLLCLAGCNSGGGLPVGQAGLCRLDNPVCPAGYTCQCQNAGACGVGMSAYCVPSGEQPCDTSGDCPNGLSCTGCGAHGPTDLGPNGCTVKTCE